MLIRRLICLLVNCIQHRTILEVCATYMSFLEHHGREFSKGQAEPVCDDIIFVTVHQALRTDQHFADTGRERPASNSLTEVKWCWKAKQALVSIFKQTGATLFCYSWSYMYMGTLFFLIPPSSIGRHFLLSCPSPFVPHPFLLFSSMVSIHLTFVLIFWNN